MKAFLERNFTKGFFLNEEHIIKINDIISKRLKENNCPEIVNYKVYRIDSLIFETEDYNKVLNEENSKRNKINKIEISHSSDKFKFGLVFCIKENVHLQLEGEEKDFTYLLFSDLKEYLTTEVLKFRKFNFNDLRVDKYIFPIIMIFLLGLSISSINKNNLSPSQLNSLISSNSIERKLNFLIDNTQTRGGSANFYFIMLATILIFIMVYPVLALLDRLYPRNIFYLGKTIAFYDKICSIRNKLIWGIVIAFVISIISGLLVFKITN